MGCSKSSMRGSGAEAFDDPNPPVHYSDESEADLPGPQTQTPQTPSKRKKKKEKKSKGSLSEPPETSELLRIKQELNEGEFVGCVDVSNMEIGDAGVEGLVAAMSTQGNEVWELVLDSNRITKRGASHIGEFVQKSSSISSVSMNDNVVGGEVISTMLSGAYAKGKSSLSAISVNGNFIDDFAVEHLTRVLKDNKCLTSLNMDSNSMHAPSGHCFGEALSHNSALTTLSLRHNKLSDEGVTSLLQGLRANMALTTLRLANNNLTAQVGEEIAHFLAENKILVVLDIRDNKLEAAGTEAIAKALTNNANLQQLDLFNNNIYYNGIDADSSGIKALLKYLPNKSLQKINVKGNTCDYPAAVDSVSALVRIGRPKQLEVLT